MNLITTVRRRMRHVPQRVHAGTVSRLVADDDAGQATAEYALILVAAAAVVGAVIDWVSGTGRIGELFDTVFDRISGALG